jgi:hypothetical protein
MREDANVRLTRGLYDAFSRGDIGAVLNFSIRGRISFLRGPRRFGGPEIGTGVTGHPVSKRCVRTITTAVSLSDETQHAS